jgi:hypothetical protein
LPNDLSRQPKASRVSRAKSNGHPAMVVVSVVVVSRAVFPSKLRKAVFPACQFVGELRALLLEL